MQADPNHDGIGVGPNPEPEPGNCPHCGWEMNVAERMNEDTDAFITSFIYECPECEARYIDRAGT